MRVGELEALARTKTNLNGMQRWGYVVVGPDLADGRLKAPRHDWLIRATGAGRKAQEIWRPLFSTTEERWEARFGEGTIHTLRKSLECMVGDTASQRSPLFRGLDAYPEGWWAAVHPPDTLPHYPMITHRGGFPDGS